MTVKSYIKTNKSGTFSLSVTVSFLCCIMLYYAKKQVRITFSGNGQVVRDARSARGRHPASDDYTVGKLHPG